MTIRGNFERFQYFDLETDFLEKENLFQKTGVSLLSWKHLNWKCIISIQNCQIKWLLRQIEWWVQNGPITKKGVLPVTTLLFSKFCFNLKTSHYKELIWCTNDPNVYIHTFYKRWSFFWQCFLPVSILNVKSSTYYFHMKTKISADFQICISVPLIFEDFKRKSFYKLWVFE